MICDIHPTAFLCSLFIFLFQHNVDNFLTCQKKKNPQMCTDEHISCNQLLNFPLLPEPRTKDCPQNFFLFCCNYTMTFCVTFIIR